VNDLKLAGKYVQEKKRKKKKKKKETIQQQTKQKRLFNEKMNQSTHRTIN
jgi:hypothetical protein